MSVNGDRSTTTSSALRGIGSVEVAAQRARALEPCPPASAISLLAVQILCAFAVLMLVFGAFATVLLSREQLDGALVPLLLLVVATSLLLLQAAVLVHVRTLAVRAQASSVHLRATTRRGNVLDEHRAWVLNRTTAPIRQVAVRMGADGSPSKTLAHLDAGELAAFTWTEPAGDLPSLHPSVHFVDASGRTWRMPGVLADSGTI